MPAPKNTDLSIEALTKMIEQAAAASPGGAGQDPRMVEAIEAVARQIERADGNNEQIQAALAAVRRAISGEG